MVFFEVGIQLTFPHGYQIVPMRRFLCPFSWKCPFCVYTLRSFFFKKFQVSRTSDIWKFVQHPRGMFPFLCLLFAFHHCLFLVYTSTLRGFSVVNRICFCEDRGCEHGGGAESTVTMWLCSATPILSLAETSSGKVCVSSSWCLDMQNDVGGLGLGSLGPAV